MTPKSNVVSLCAEYHIELSFEHTLYGLSANIALRNCARQCPAGYYNNHLRGSDPLVEVPSRVEVPRPTDDLLLQPLLVHRHVRVRFDEENRRRPPVPDDDALRDESVARRTDVVLDRLCIASQSVRALDPVVVPSTGQISTGRNLYEEVASVVMPVRSAEGGMGAIARLPEDDELDKLAVQVLVGRTRVAPRHGKEAVPEALQCAQGRVRAPTSTHRHQHDAAFRVREGVDDVQPVLVRPFLVLLRHSLPRVENFVEAAELCEQLWIVVRIAHVNAEEGGELLESIEMTTRDHVQELFRGEVDPGGLDRASPILKRAQKHEGLADVAHTPSERQSV